MAGTSPESIGKARVIQALLDCDGPATVADLAATTGLATSTLREHLITLTDEGRLTRLPMRSGKRGRPQWSYLVRESEHAALARALADAVAEPGPDPVTGAERAGRSWGTRVLAELGKAVSLDLDVPDRVGLALAHTGFATKRRAGSFVITACPLLELATSQTDVVCGAHRGMLQGVARGEATVGLAPFASPSGCVVSIAH